MTARTDQAATAAQKNNPFAALPAVDALASAAQEALPGIYSPDYLTAWAQDTVQVARQGIAAGDRPGREQIISEALQRLAGIARPRLEPVLNATGVIIHTNLGRAPVSDETAAAMFAAAANPVALEIEPELNRRGGRMAEISTLMRGLTGAEATLVVNNNAAAVLLVLSALAAGGKVIVSRGEAIEIGGGFRIPDVLQQSGAKLVEVGTTNRTYADDYRQAIDDSTRLLLKVHPSNFVMIGFTASVDLSDLVAVGQDYDIPVVDDQGSGALIDPALYGLVHETTIAESLAAGTTLVTASGDKLLGGPQAGLIAGQSAFVELVAGHPLARAVRADKSCLAGIAATLRHYAAGEAAAKIPVWRMITTGEATLKTRAKAVQRRLKGLGISVVVLPVQSTVGGGALPGQTLPSWGIAFSREGFGEPGEMARQLRVGMPRVFGRVEQDACLLDLRTISPDQDLALAAAVAAAVKLVQE